MAGCPRQEFVDDGYTGTNFQRPQFREMMKQGKYVGNYALYGYMLHPTVRNKLALDTEAAAIVRRVFDEALAGRNTSQIAAVRKSRNGRRGIMHSRALFAAGTAGG